MPSIILKKYSEPTSYKAKTSSNSPLSYLDWVKQNFGIVPNNAEEQYKQYLLDWYSDKSTNLVGSSLKEDYIKLLKSLSVIFRNDDDFRRFSNIDFDDDLQLKIAIPHYVRKLKELSLYYLNKRTAIKNAKIKYNMIGSFNSVERTFYEYIQKAFSKRDYILNVPEQSAWNLFPELSSINKGFSIEIEELYDDTDYFNPSLSSNSTGIYSLTSSNPLLFIFEDFIKSEYDANSLTDIPLSSRQIPIDEFYCNPQYNINLQSLQLLNQKYIGTDNFYMTGGLFVEDSYPVELELVEGNNFFYWFSGEYLREAPHKNYVGIPINSLDWINDGATSSPIYSSSDVIFVNQNDTISGAWLASMTNILVDDVMEATIKNDRYFKFPYPGVGISAEGIEWTGKLIKDYNQYNKTFFPNQGTENEIIKELDNLYWTTTDSISSIKPMSIHDTSIILDGAYASKVFDNADKLLTRTNVDIDSVHDTKKNATFTGQYNQAWAYDFTKTELSILDGVTNIYWPIQTFLDVDDITIEYTAGDSLGINDIDISHFGGAIAATSINEADLIIKEESCGHATEAAWLKGTPLSAFNVCAIETEVLTSTFTNTVSSKTKVTVVEDWTPLSLEKIKVWFNSNNVNSKSWLNLAGDGGSLVPQSSIGASISVRLANGSFNYDSATQAITLSGGNLTGPGPEFEGAGGSGALGKIKQPFMAAMVFNTNSITGTQRLINQMSDKGKNNGIILENSTLSLLDGDTSKVVTSSVSIQANTWYYVIGIFDGNDSSIIVNGTETTGKLKSKTSFNQLIIGSDSKTVSQNNFIGKIRDIVISTKIPSDADLDKLKTYLNKLLGNVPERPSSEQTLIETTVYNQFTNVQNVVTTQGDFVSGSTQPGLFIKADPGYSRFVWTGESERKTRLSDLDAFTGHNHDDTCRFKINNSKIEDWTDCDCKSIIYSPQGHSGSLFNDGVADYIILDTAYPDYPTLNSWVGEDGLGYLNSVDFGWFKLDENQEGSNFGKGKWVTNKGKEFYLTAGRTYLYFRQSINCIDESPYFIIKHAYCNCIVKDCNCETINCRPVWMQANLVNGVWVDSGLESTMTLESNKKYVYNHKSQLYFSKLVERDDELVEVKDCIPSIDFLLSVEVPNLIPYWGKSTFDQNKYTLQRE